MISSCRWSGSWKAALARITELEKRLVAFERPAKTPDCRCRRGKSLIVPPARSRHAGAAPRSGGRCVRTRIAWSTSFSPPVRIARRHCRRFPRPHSKPTTDRTTADQAGRDTGAPVRRSLRLLRRARGHISTGRAGTRFAIRSVDRCLGGLPALYHAISMERLATLMEEIFSLTLSEGCDQQHTGPRA